jgi:hypothetical protein
MSTLAVNWCCGVYFILDAGGMASTTATPAFSALCSLYYYTTM